MHSEEDFSPTIEAKIEASPAAMAPLAVAAQPLFQRLELMPGSFALSRYPFGQLHG